MHRRNEVLLRVFMRTLPIGTDLAMNILIPVRPLIQFVRIRYSDIADFEQWLGRSEESVWDNGGDLTTPEPEVKLPPRVTAKLIPKPNPRFPPVVHVHL